MGNDLVGRDSNFLVSRGEGITRVFVLNEGCFPPVFVSWPRFAFERRIILFVMFTASVGPASSLIVRATGGVVDELRCSVTD